MNEAPPNPAIRRQEALPRPPEAVAGGGSGNHAEAEAEVGAEDGGGVRMAVKKVSPWFPTIKEALAHKEGPWQGLQVKAGVGARIVDRRLLSKDVRI